MSWEKFSAKSVDEALIEAMIKMETTVDNIEYEVIEKGSSGFLGFLKKPAIIKARIKKKPDVVAKAFLKEVLGAMKIECEIKINYIEEKSILDIEIEGEDMGVVIGKRGQTLDSVQYLVSLVVNKESDNYIKVKLDTENYRSRRKATLENLAKNIAFKVKKTKKSVTLEPMNPYERRIIHSTLQNDKQIQTYSDGKEPYRKIVIDVKDGKGAKRKPAPKNFKKQK